MKKSKLLANLKAQGLSLSVEGPILQVRPKEAITSELAKLIGEHKGELFAAVWQAEDRTCPACGAPEMRRFSAMIVHGYVRFQCPRCGCVLAADDRGGGSVSRPRCAECPDMTGQPDLSGKEERAW